MYDDITVVYMTLEEESSEWRLLLLSDFEKIGIVPKRYQGIPGDVGEARYQMLLDVDTEFVYVADPDDRVIPEVFLEQLHFMRRNPDYDICGCAEQTITPSGVVLNSSHRRGFDIQRFRVTPMELHNGSIVRMSAVRKLINHIHDANFYNFDWALRYSIASTGKSHRIGRVGYQFRKKSNSHHQALDVPDGMVHPRNTIETVDSIIAKHLKPEISNE